MLVVGALVGIAAGASAQSAPALAGVVSGTCSEPGQQLTILTEPSAGPLDGDEVPADVEQIVAALEAPVETSLTNVPLALDDIMAQQRAIMVEVGTGDSARLACGEVGGSTARAADVQVGLAGVAGSGTNGVAWLHANDDGTTTIAIVVASGDHGQAMAAADESIAIRESLYLPSPFVVARGTTVTWTNEDALPHTATATDGAFDSGYLGQGDSYSLTFDAPGTFAYFCAYHPRMRATITVE
jgi:plastocyanin